ncbi:transcriptional regulator [Gracilibacillus xinjiangensis]|uniref:Transcriptional regulator n=1 Tax=Gracilibacillus xinjiangensis TaxID=1193282 RepID=A0ABV8X3A0_9BACI
MKRKYILIFFIGVVLIMGFLFNFTKDNKLSTEKFIEKWFLNANGTLATNVLDSDRMDADLVKGREALSETIGLWLIYAVEKQDKQMFEKAYNILLNYFLTENGFVSWKLTETGIVEVTTNALIDDLRIIDALYRAEKLWNIAGYGKVAEQIGTYLTNYNRNGLMLTDYYDQQYQTSSAEITLSYIDPISLEKMLKQRVLDKQTYHKMVTVLKEAEKANGFFPKAYHVQNNQYRHDQEVHMIDQGLVAYHQALMGSNNPEFLQFIKTEMMTNGKIAGAYNPASKKPAVHYESPAVYGILIWYCLEINETELAAKLYKRMTEYRNDNIFSRYYGGYTVDDDGDTHIFDNLVPLIAEQRLMEHGDKF